MEKIISEQPSLEPNALEILADYLILCMEKQERKQKKILTENRMTTVNKRETSFEGLVSQFENGEDGIYSIITEDKNQIFRPKVQITKRDIEEIAPLAQLREAIEYWENKKGLTGRDAYIVKRTLIDLRKDQYVIKNAYRRPITLTKITRSRNTPKLDQIELTDPKVCSAILCNYSRLKQDSYSDFENDTWFMIYDFERALDEALAPHPLYRTLIELKIDGMQNSAIQLELQRLYGIRHSVEYISSLWRNKIPMLIASAAEDQYLRWYYLNVEKGQYKKCTCCGEIKLAHPKYYSRNNTAKDGWYSICKNCRNLRRRKKSGAGPTCSISYP